MKTLFHILIFVLVSQLGLASELTTVKVIGQSPTGSLKTYQASDLRPAVAEKQALQKCHDSGSEDCEVSEGVFLDDSKG